MKKINTTILPSFSKGLLLVFTLLCLLAVGTLHGRINVLTALSMSVPINLSNYLDSSFAAILKIQTLLERSSDGR